MLIAVAAIEGLISPFPRTIAVPASLSGRVRVLGGSVDIYHLFIIILCSAIAVMLQIIYAQTRFGLQARATAENRRDARGLGIGVDRLFAITFAAGSGLAGLGGALVCGFNGFGPNFPFTTTVYALIIAAVGGVRTILGPFIAAIVLGLVDIFGRSEFPAFGGYFIYAVLLVALILRRRELISRYAPR